MATYEVLEGLNVRAYNQGRYTPATERQRSLVYIWRGFFASERRGRIIPPNAQAQSSMSIQADSAEPSPARYRHAPFIPYPTLHAVAQARSIDIEPQATHQRFMDRGF